MTTPPAPSYSNILTAAQKWPEKYDICPMCGGTKTKDSKLCFRCTFGKRTVVTQPDDPSYRFIPLTQGQYAIVDAVDYERLMQWIWCARWS